MNWNTNPPPAGVNPQYTSFNYKPGGFEPPSGQKNQPQKHRPGVPGGSWDVDDEPIRINKTRVPVNPTYSEPTPPVAPPVAPSVAPSVAPVAPAPQPPQPPALLTSTEPGLYERRLVEEATMPGGARPRPPEKDLAEFSSKVKFLQSNIIGNYFLETLQDRQRALKALHYLDRLVSDYESYKEFAQDNIQAIQSAAYSSAHSRILQTLLSKLDSTQSTVEDIISF